MNYDNDVHEFNLNRSYYLLNDKKQYISDYNNVLQKGATIFTKDKIMHYIGDGLKIMSYNIRYFTNINDEPIIDGIVDTILEYSPHVVCLQEVALGNNQYYEQVKKDTFFLEHFNRLLEKYQIISTCAAPPAFYSSFYGNMVLIHKKVVENILTGSTDADTLPIRNTLCTSSMNKCYLNQQIHNYTNVPESHCSLNTLKE